MADGHYTADVFSFEIIDRVVVDAFAILKAEVSIFRDLEIIKRHLMLLNGEKQKLMAILGISYAPDFKNDQINAYRQLVKDVIPDVTILAERIELSLKEKFGIENPYKI